MDNFYCFQQISWQKITPCYFLYGEEKYLARVFLEILKQKMVPEEETCPIEKFELKNVSWSEVLETARQNPVLFSPFRLVIIQDSFDSETGEKKFTASRLNETEKKIIKLYLSSPTPATVIVIIVFGEGKTVRKTALFRFFKSLPPRQVQFIELKASLGEKKQWVRKQFASLGQIIEADALERLLELVGPDLALLYQEVEKISLFAADKKRISIEDINQVTGWVAEVDAWALEECLERGQVEGCISVCHRLLAKGVKEEYILHQMIRFFRDIFWAKQLLGEGGAKKEVFRQVKPYLKEKFSFYQEKFEGFFHLVDRLRAPEIDLVFQKLKEVDQAIKTTDLPSVVVFENFFFYWGELIRGS